MKKIKKYLIAGLTVGMVMIFAGCSNNSAEEQSLSNFKFVVESNEEFDYIDVKLGDFESKMEPMHDDKSVKAGYSSNVSMPEEEMIFSIKAVKDNKTVLEENDIKIDLTEGKSVKVKLVDTKDNGLNIEIE